LDAQQNDERSGGTRHGQANDLWMARNFFVLEGNACHFREK
jgi:hypothetical protein